MGSLRGARRGPVSETPPGMGSASGVLDFRGFPGRNGREAGEKKPAAGVAEVKLAGRAPAEGSSRGEESMCRNIKTLFNFQPVATDDEVRAASLQFVRKLSGFNKPSRAN